MPPNNKIKVLHIISGDLWAGAEVMAYNLLKCQKENPDLSLTILLLNKGRLAFELEKIGLHVKIIEEKHISFLQLVSRVAKIIFHNPPDIIHSHRYKENLLAFMASLNNRNIKLVATQHGMPEGQPKAFQLKKLLIRKLNFYIISRCFNHLITVSDDIREIFINFHKFNPSKVTTIHNGIELTPRYERNSRPYFVIGSAGRLFPVKDFPLLVEITKVVATKTNKIKFVLAGEGPGQPELQTLIDKYKLHDTFKLLGHQENMDFFYRDLDLYINTSVHEGIPMSVLEAMSYNLPVIAPAVGGFMEIIDNGQQGYLIHDRNPDIFAEKCYLLFNNRVLWKKMSIQAREKIIQDFSVSKMAANYYKLYAKLVI